MTTDKLALWFLKSAVAAAVMLMVLTSPALAVYQPPVAGESCLQTCQRWGQNGFVECQGSTNINCNSLLVSSCMRACNSNSPPVGITCDSGTNVPGGPTNGGCVSTGNPTLGAGGCSNGCWSNGPCANTVCSRPPSWSTSAQPGCACRDKKLFAIADNPDGPVVGE